MQFPLFLNYLCGFIKMYKVNFIVRLGPFFLHNVDDFLRWLMV
jgi:hypothetical protein